MTDSTIEWTDKTWNPTKGCNKVSPGCKNCYAIRMAARLQAIGYEAYQGTTHKNGRLNWTGKIGLDEKALAIPMQWKKPSRVFVNSMSDLFHESIPQDYLERIWSVMLNAPHHQFQVLTKRPEQMQSVLKGLPVLPNVWLGVSVESADYLYRLDVLRDISAAVRFVSFEPLLESVAGANLSDIAWAIVGGESGPKSRPIEEEWVAEIKEACDIYNTAFFFKQWGGVQKKKTGRVWKNRMWDEYPQALLSGA